MLNLNKSLPETPGIYIFSNASTPIYIGKAINLKRRASSYFDLKLETKTEKMISEATKLDFIQVTSEFEALLLEAKLIKKYQPHYNIISKDDKHPLYIVITNEDFPRIICVRKLIANNYSPSSSFGPFPSSKSVYTVLRMLRRIFPYSDHTIGKKPCFYSHIGLCNPCPNEIVQSTEYLVLRKKYLKNIKNVKAILSGKIAKVSKDLEKEMAKFAQQEKYEEATKIRSQLTNLTYITKSRLPSDYYIQNPNLYEDQRKLEIKELEQLIKNLKLKINNLNRIECFDIAHLAGTNATASMVTFINGQADKNYYRHFKIANAKGGDDYGSMREVAARRKKNFTTWGKPDLIIVDGGLGQVQAFSQEIEAIPIVGIAKHPDRLIIANQKIKLTGPALNLVSRIRDEAHRFARRYHHKLISRSIITF